MVDALRADHVGCYGYRRPTSPNIDNLAAGGTQFVNGISTTPWTLPSIATMMTGLYPSAHGAIRTSNVMRCVVNPADCHPVDTLDASRTTLAEVLQRHGIRTAAFVPGSGYASPVFGFGQGFDHFATDHVMGRFLVEALTEWLDQVRPQRFFAYIHFIEVHAPYTGPNVGPVAVPADAAQRARAAARAEEGLRYRQFDFDPEYRGPMDGSIRALKTIERPQGRDLDHLIALYDQGIAYTDYWVGQLMEALAKRGLSDETIVLVTADHGEELMDHGRLRHGASFYEESMRVPFILRVPHQGTGRVVEEQVGLIDVLPTLVDLLGIAEPLDVQGRSLRPLLNGEPLPERTMFGEAAMLPNTNASRTNRWKYMRSGGRGPELYDLQADPRETINLCQRDREQCRPFAAQLFEHQAQAAAAASTLPTPQRAEIDEKTRERLRAIGYEDH